MHTRKEVLRFMATYFSCFVLVSLMPSFLDRPEYARAFSLQYRNPTPGNAAFLRIQQRKNEVLRIESTLTLSFILACAVYGVYILLHTASDGLKALCASKTRAIPERVDG